MRASRLRFCEAILTDETNQSEKLVRPYEESDMNDKNLTNGVLIIICGYSLSALKTFVTLDERGSYFRAAPMFSTNRFAFVSRM